MSARRRKRRKPPRLRVNVLKPSEFLAWANYWGCTQQNVRDAVKISGVKVEDVDRVHAAAIAAELPIALSLRDEDFGQRHFMTTDPDGLLVDVITVIPYVGDLAESAAVSGGPQ